MTGRRSLEGFPGPLPATFEFTAGGSSLQAGGRTNSAQARSSGVISGWTLLVRSDDPAASVVADVFKTSVGGYGTGTSITGSAKPSLTGQSAATSTNLTGWTPAIASGDIFYATIVSATGNIKGLTLELF